MLDDSLPGHDDDLLGSCINLVRGTVIPAKAAIQRCWVWRQCSHIEASDQTDTGSIPVLRLDEKDQFCNNRSKLLLRKDRGCHDLSDRGRRAMVGGVHCGKTGHEAASQKFTEYVEADAVTSINRAVGYPHGPVAVSASLSRAPVVD